MSAAANALDDREAALDPRAHWAHVRYRPHKGQRRIHASTSRHRVAACGRRFGKSQVGGHELSMEHKLTEIVLHTLRDSPQRREFWCVGPEYSDAEKEFRVVWNDLKRMGVPMDKPGSYYNPEASDMAISCMGGKLMIHGKSSKYPDSLVGEGLAGVIMCEAAKMKASVWGKYIRPALADVRGWSLWLSTPEGKNHFYEAYQRGLDPAHPAWDCFRMPSWTNPYVFPLGENDPEIIEMRAEMSEQRAAQEIEASFTEYVGAVFKAFDEEVHVRDLRYRRDLPVYLACDFGWSNPFVLLVIQIDVWQNVYVLGEYRTVQKDINEICVELDEWDLARQGVLLYPDPAEPDDAQVLGTHLRCAINADTGGPLKHRLEYIRRGLKRVPEHLPDEHPEKQPKLFIDRSCVGLIREMQDYRYPENKSEVRPDPEAPLDKDNHAPEALGRFYRGHFGPPKAPGDTRTNHAEVSRARLSSGGRRRR